MNKIISPENKNEWEKKAKNFFKITIDNRTASNCEMLCNNAFFPLSGFMSKAEAESVIENICLPDGTLWSIPVLFPINKEISDLLNKNQEIALYDSSERLIAIMSVQENFNLDLENYCNKIFKTFDINHPGVKNIIDSGNNFISGELILINRPLRNNISEKYFIDPSEVKEIFKDKNWKNIIAFQTRNPIHRAHEYLIKCSMEMFDGVFIQPLVGETKSDDIPPDIRMKCYEELIENYFNKNRLILAVLPAPMNYAGPREAIHHMIIRQNYGCTHMIIGRDHAGVGNYYGTYEAQAFVSNFEDKMRIKPVKFENTFFCNKCKNIASSKTCPHDTSEHLVLSGTKVRDMLGNGEIPPEEFTRKEISNILSDFYNN